MRGAARGKVGLTLLEMVVTLFIISLLFAVAMPSFRSSGGRLKAEAREVASVIRYLNDVSATRKTVSALKFDFKAGAISWRDGERDKGRRLKSLHSVELTTKGAVMEGELTVFFTPMGQAERMTVHLQLDEKKMDVSFNPISRRTTISALEE